ncbi:MAG: class I SAM-dependent methyltransferase [Pyrinomonadaceae bacterium]
MTRNATRHRFKPPVYDRLASHYDRALRPFERWGLARLRAAALAELPTDSRILEVGAGTGLNFAHYPANSRGAASELSGEMIEVARGRHERPSGVRLCRARAERLPFADDSFDAACATLVFCSVASPREAFAELRRTVRTGGIVVLLEHVRPGGLLGYLFDALNVLTVALFEDHFNRRTSDEAKRAKLSVVRVERHLLGIVQIIVCRVE